MQGRAPPIPGGGNRPPPRAAPVPTRQQPTYGYDNSASNGYANNNPSYNSSPSSYTNESTPSYTPTSYSPPTQQPRAITGERTYSEKISDYLVNDGPKILFIFLWMCGNISLFIWQFYTYQAGNRSGCQQLGVGRPFARGAAECLKFNSALMALTMARNFLSWIRSSIFGTIIPVDKNIIFHRYIGWTIAFFAGMHIFAWWFNYKILPTLSVLTLVTNCSFPEFTNHSRAPYSYELAYFQLPGSTGHIITLIMVLMYSSAIRYIRGPMFNVFWYAHHLFILYWALLVIHGRFLYIGTRFNYPTFGLYFCFPGLVYIIERTVRVLRGSQDTILLQAIAHPSKVIELQMKKASFKYKPGQYLFLNCPYIAAQEWHPFTISSAPEENFISVHIRIVGDWTGSLWNLMNPEKKLGVVQENLLTCPDGRPIFRIDGPFGAASEDVFGFRTVVLVAGGIGVTPFGSILKSIRYRLETSGKATIQKAYFFWISRDKNSFEWFNDILAALENNNINDFLEINTYLTGQLSLDEIKNVMYSDSDADQITGLQSPTYFGRPDWNSIFDGLSKKHSGEEVGVFFCGPSVLSKSLYQMSRKYTSTKTNTKFKFHKENF